MAPQHVAAVVVKVALDGVGRRSRRRFVPRTVSPSRMNSSRICTFIDHVAVCWAPTRSPSESRCGWAFSWDGAPKVAQRKLGDAACAAHLGKVEAGREHHRTQANVLAGDRMAPPAPLPAGGRPTVAQPTES